MPAVRTLPRAAAAGWGGVAYYVYLGLLRLAAHLSRDAGGSHTARFFADGLECALFTFDGDGEGRAWVAGVTLSKDARVRIVHAGMAEAEG